MATEQQLIEALRRADAAGNAQDAQRIADAIKETRESAAEPPKPSRLDIIKGAAEKAARNLTSGNELAATLRTQALGITSGAFGVGDRIVRENLKNLVPDATDEELSEGTRAFMRTAFQQRPAAFGTGFAAGGVGTGGVIARGAGAIAPRLGAVGRAVSGAFRIKKGQPIANLAKGAAIGATATGAQTGIAEERLPSSGEAAFGAAFGAAVPTALEGVRRAVRPITSSLRPEAAARTAALQEVQRTTGMGGREAADTIARRVDTEEAIQRGTPALTEVLEPAEAAALGERAGRRSDAASRTLSKAVEEQAGRRMQRMQDSAVASGPAKAAADVRKEASDRFTRVMRERDPFGKKGVNLGVRMVTVPLDDAKTLISRRDFARTLSADAMQAVNDAIDNDAPARIALSDLDETRAALSAASDRVEVGGARFKDMSQRLRAIGGRQIPLYERELRRLARENARADGIEAGRAALTGPATEEVAIARRTSREAKELSRSKPRAEARAKAAGVAEGGRAALVERVGSPTGSARTARDIAGGGTMRKRIAAAFGQKEAGRMAQAASSEMRRAEGTVTAGVASQRGAKAALSNASEISSILEAGALASGRGSAGFNLHIIQRLTQKFDIPPSVAERLARRASDPSRTHQFVAALRRRGISEDDIMDMYRGASAAGGVFAAQAPSKPELRE